MKPNALIRPRPPDANANADAWRRRYGDGNKRVYGITAFVSLGALLFGYDQGVMGVIIADRRFLDLMRPQSAWVTGAIVSLYDIGCLLGALSIGFLADRIGRERTLAVATLVFNLGAVLQAASYSVSQIIIGRIVLGIGVGICAGGVPLYIGEIAPAKLRGRIVGIEQMILCLGELIAFWLNYGFAMLPSAHWWRIPLAIQVLPAGVLGVGCWLYVPPSPRWLVDQGRPECAREVLTRLHGSEAADRSLREIRESIRFQKTVAERARWVELFRRPVLRVTLLGMGVQFFQQITGTCSIIYYLPHIFAAGGISNPRTQNLLNGTVGIVLFLSAWIPIFLFDRLGRRTWLRLGCIGMAVAMIGIAVFQRNAARHPESSSTNIVIVIFPYLFYTCFNATWGVGSWLYASEIWPIRYRAKGNGVTTATLWLGTFCVAQLSPVVFERVGWGLYAGYAGLCGLAYLFVQFCMVETRGRSLEDMSRLFGIDDGLRLRRRRTILRRQDREHNDDGLEQSFSTDKPEASVSMSATTTNTSMPKIASPSSTTQYVRA
ncbi:permease of the major facilitator superfamily [Pseudovirgaria hyperparasitica]|uniref:Permease of the major facilitator superfamily n=1 Tax=Pseudovirgaria hyperparasitica TaxID=470096 RepID=A0A6A6WJI5_9PEZI|nr:permease of the major facilitator superfamily [Pseudovirgaria hyperparasitica]KAF2762350.1 permease of the major facilitator superfamily [Pseudovirgaria hyperparasitica]